MIDHLSRDQKPVFDPVFHRKSSNALNLFLIYIADFCSSSRNIHAKRQYSPCPVNLRAKRADGHPGRLCHGGFERHAKLDRLRALARSRDHAMASTHPIRSRVQDTRRHRVQDIPRCGACAGRGELATDLEPRFVDERGR
ncbi:hypothetical protein [Nguyenibacter vanlangensis]|uniref:Uncharacterized protein n=1 Tax=Nguyenibacter vanlangensis TaxID=1216886 RepID=A0A7Y7ITM1_9PROT|nr:hypothetical protein [Nguyenibacter vanlangensis]NVN10113.1 hypothetical protein [Nguyenibacter vanlangensis]